MELDTEAHFYRSGNSCISKPEILGSFSVNLERDALNREYVPDCSQLKFLHRGIATTGVEYDLNYNAATTITRTNLRHDATFLCHFLKDNKSPIDIFDSSEISLKDAPFVTYGESLGGIGSITYERTNNVNVTASLFKGVVYLLDWCEIELGDSEWSKKVSGWGHKFKQLILADYSNSQPDMESPLIEGKSFRLVHGAKLGEHRLLYATTVGAVMCEESENIPKGKKTAEMLNDLKFVQVKINRHLKEPWAIDKFMTSRSLTLWLNSYLTGVDTILCGYRDNDGIVTELKFYTTTELCTKYRKKWQPNVTINFCNAFLSFVKKCLSEELLKRHGECLDDIRNLPRVDLIFEKKPNGNVRLCDDVEYPSIIPEWFIDLLTK